jgi:hypothetical protein
MSNNTLLDLINVPPDNDNDKIPDSVWQNEIDGKHFDYIGGFYDNNDGEVKQRNDTIESIRYTEEGKGAGKRFKYIKKMKNGVDIYRSFEHRQQFLKEVESKGLVKNSTSISKDRVTDDYFRSGLEVLFG